MDVLKKAPKLTNINPAYLTADTVKAESIERQNLTLRTQIKRLARRTICFSKLELMRDTVIGLFINYWEFGLHYRGIVSY